jgi:hypothetical protein
MYLDRREAGRDADRESINKDCGDTNAVTLAN